MAGAVASCQPSLVPIPDFPEHLTVLRPPDLEYRNQVCGGDDLYSRVTGHQSLGKMHCGTIDAAVKGAVAVAADSPDLEESAVVIAVAVDVKGSGSTSLPWLETPTQPSDVDVGAQGSTSSRAVIFLGTRAIFFCLCQGRVCPTVEADEANSENR